ncbi:unnamed protein product [Spirodela intermedia]|uniref:Dirigent protein n=1 Tax=Spirodela intermedia TaxID=51605 RepID=A0A7I8J4V5_SPIIN|nr:unnamed protein product [Spirodela intermedia]CAA6664411.1 unnamed protein product [Spirodela intermedia]
MRRAAVRSPLARVAVFFLCLSLVIVQGYVVREESPHNLGKEKVTQLHFFFHDTVTGKNPTAVLVAKPNGTFPFNFGSLMVIDDVLTTGVDRASKVVGNAQGFYALTGLTDLSLVLAVDFGFTTGKYNGSSFSVMSRNPGQFRMARGVAFLTTRVLRGINAIVEYNVTLLHY